MASRRPGRVDQWVAVALLVVGVLTTVGGALALRTGYHLNVANSHAMSPTVQPNDGVLAVDASSAQRGDLVLVDAPEWGLHGLVLKRVAGVGGDKVACCTDQKLIVNGKPLEGPAGVGIGSPYTVTVPPGRYFLVGDHLDDSIDSQLFHDKQEQGTLPASAIRQRVVWTSPQGARALPTGVVTWFAVSGVGLLLAAAGLITLIIVLLRRLSRASRKVRQPVTDTAATDS